jgi:hypothetical protein
LVVGIVVDQNICTVLLMIFSPNGFKRLMDNGYTYQNMHFNYMPTYNGSGTCFNIRNSTNHGIVSNEWFSRKLVQRCIALMMQA